MLLGVKTAAPPRASLDRALALCAVLAALATSCSQTCEDACSEELDDCLAHAPPGASKADCQTEYQQCLDSCNASATPEGAAR